MTELLGLLSELGRMMMRNHQQLLTEIRAMSTTVTDGLATIQAQVAATIGVEQSAVVLIQGLYAQLGTISAELAAQGSDTTALDALAASLSTGTDALSAAIANVGTIAATGTVAATTTVAATPTVAAVGTLAPGSTGVVDVSNRPPGWASPTGTVPASGTIAPVGTVTAVGTIAPVGTVTAV